MEVRLEATSTLMLEECIVCGETCRMICNAAVAYTNLGHRCGYVCRACIAIGLDDIWSRLGSFQDYLYILIEEFPERENELLQLIEELNRECAAKEACRAPSLTDWDQHQFQLSA